MPWNGDDRLAGNDGVLTITTVNGTGSPIILDIEEFDYGEVDKYLEGSTAGNRATGRVFLRTDWDLNVRARIRRTGTTPNFFPRNAIYAFDARSDGDVTPAVKVVGSGVNAERRLRVPVDQATTVTLKVLCFDPAEANLPVVTMG